MNAADKCHQVDGCPGLYIDAFRGQFLRQTQDPDNAFILTHYHGDHYQNLPRDGKYQGPAHIHCTPVTAALLIRVHNVPEILVVEHEYGQTFCQQLKGRGKEKARITFYDANHCPGACIVLIQLPNGRTHLHTGDMRYHERFKSYPLLREVATNNQLDIIYLDTTYSHPKHDFVPQDEAIQAIADKAAELLGSGSDFHPDASSKLPKTLILLSCYSIGKEKVLWETSTRTNQLVYVTEKKFRMMQCIQGHESQEISSQIIHRCTQDSNRTPIHVIPMGLAGETWPYFRPNFIKCAEYARKLDQGYQKVVAFLPTGWAHGSKWNREHSVSQKTVPAKIESGIEKNLAPIDVEVRLIPYSEHSAFSELISFVQYLRPRKVIPTVFGDDADYRKIENRFRNLLDTKRAKQAFFRSMEPSLSPFKSVVSSENGEQYNENDRNDATTKFYAQGVIDMNTAPADKVPDDQSDESVEILPGITKGTNKALCRLAHESHVATLSAMGFDSEKAGKVIAECNGDLDRAIEKLLSGENSSSNTPPWQVNEKKTRAPHISPNDDSANAKKKQKGPSGGSTPARITSFFVRKKS